MPFFGSLAILFGRVLLVVAAILSEISTLAGSGVPGFFDGSVQFQFPGGVALDSAGNIYVAGNNRIRKITPLGLVTTLAGSTSGFADGTGTSAQFNSPQGVAVDSSGNVYVTDRANNRIRKITPAGVVTTLAGQTTSGSTDGTGTNAMLNQPFGIAINSSGDIFVTEDTANRIRRITSLGVVTTFVSSGLSSPVAVAFNSIGELYVSNSGNHYISRVSTLGVVTNIAGNGSASVNGGGPAIDGTGTNVVFTTPIGLGVDSAGIVYIADANNRRIRKMTPAGVVTTLAGSLSNTAGFADGTGTDAMFNYPFGIVVDSTGNVYVGDSSNHRIRKITPAGLVSTFAGSGVAGSTDSIQTNFLFNSPIGVAVDSVGIVYVGDSLNNCIRKITPAGVVTTLAGSGTATFADGTGDGARFNQPGGVAVDSAGNVYVADQSNQYIRRITPLGVVTTLAGNGTNGFTNGTGTNASFNGPSGVAVDSAGNIYVADQFNHVIRKITPTGVVTTLAGSGTLGSADGTGAAASFWFPYSVSIDSAGTVYVADGNNNRIRKITPAGVVTTFAGQTAAGSTNGTGAGASFNAPLGVAVDSFGNVYVADTNNHRIRKITPLGVVTTFAGSSQGSTDATGTNAQLNRPQGVAVDSGGNLYVAEYTSHRIRKITSAAVVTTFAGSTVGYSDGGWLSNPVGVTTDWDGTLYVADTNNHRIRKITPAGIVSTLAGQTSSGSTNGTGTSARFWFPRGVALDSTLNVYVADSTSRQIRRITPAGVVTTLAGSGISGFADATGTSATFNTPVGITVDPLNTIYVSDIGNHNIRRITPGGVVTTLAGSRTATFADGVGTNASFNTPSGIVADIYGNVYVADTNNHRIRRVTSDGTVTTLAGSTTGFADGTGTNAQFNFPYHLSIDALGTLYVADQTNNRIRTIQPSTGVVSTLAGDGTAGFTPSRFKTPQGITVDRFRNAYVADSSNHSIRKIPNAFTLPENNGVVTTIAGDGTQAFLDGTGIGARFNNPIGLSLDLNGNIYVGDQVNHRIRRISPLGVVTTLAGSGTGAFADGTGAAASFNSPCITAVDSAGNVYVADQSNHRIRKITPAGVVTTLAGQTSSGSANGTGAAASFFFPFGVAVDSSGTVYVADAFNNLIRKITPAGVVTTLAGTTSASWVDGVGTNARFSGPFGISVDSAGNVYVGDGNNHRIRRITPAGVVTTLAGNGGTTFADGTGTNATFNQPRAVPVDSAGNVYVGDIINHRIRRITPAGVVTTLAGNGTTTFTDGTGTNATFNEPYGVAVDSGGTVYVADMNNRRIRKIGSGVPQLPLNRTVVTTFAGNGGTTFANGTGTSATFNDPYGVAVDSAGNVYVADVANHRIRSITPAGVVTTLAGSGTAAFANGTGASATFNGPAGITVDSARNVYVADTGNHRIRMITSAGVVTTLAGSGGTGFTNGTGAGASFISPAGVSVDTAGNVYVADTGNRCIRRITPAGVVTTFAGSGTAAFADGTGTNATFNGPSGVGVDLAGNVYVADQNNNLIRRITPAGVVTTFAGQLTPGSADGTGTNATFNAPYGITVDSEGNVYVGDQSNNRIRKITPLGIVTTLVGTTQSFADGTGTNVTFNTPRGIAVDSGGILYVADQLNNRIRKIQ